MTDNSKSNPGKSPATRLSVGIAVNIVLSFVFVVLGITFSLWPAFWQFGRNWVTKESILTVGYVILGIGVVLGLLNAFLSYSRIKAKTSSNTKSGITIIFTSASTRRWLLSVNSAVE